MARVAELAAGGGGEECHAGLALVDLSNPIRHLRKHMQRGLHCLALLLLLALGIEASEVSCRLPLSCRSKHSLCDHPATNV